MFVVAMGYGVYTAYLQVDMHNGLGTFSYDVGLYDQGIWLLSRGHAPFVTLMGRNLFGDHASFILLLLVPFYWVIPGTSTLLVLQAMAVAAAAIPLYFLAKHVLESSELAFIFGIVWLLNPAVNGTNLENFHPDGFLGLFVALAMYAAITKKWRMYAIAIALILLVKEDVLLLVFPLGVYIFARFDKRKGVFTVLATFAVTIFGMFAVMKSLIGVPTRNTWRIPFGGPTGLIKEAFTNPTNVWKYLLQDDRPQYLFQMFAPLAGAFFLSPWMAIVAAPVLASNVVSNFWYQHSIQYHYSLIAVPALVVASILGVKRIRPAFRPLATSVILACTVLTYSAWGQTTLAQKPRVVWGADHPIARSGLDIIKMVPDNAAVSVFDPLTTHMAHRKDVYFFPNPFKASYYGVDDSLKDKRLPVADRIEYVVLPKSLDTGQQQVWDSVKAEFEVVKENSYWQVFRRIGH
jgi:uncharacterized membrane protein